MGSAEVAQGSTDTPGSEASEIPGWYLWSSDAGKPYATRSPAVLTPEQERAGCDLTVGGDNPEDLRAKIAAQPDNEQDPAADETADA
jgi:hypothetical protein